jgi:hypothetical protein
MYVIRHTVVKIQHQEFFPGSGRIHDVDLQLSSNFSYLALIASVVEIRLSSGGVQGEIDIEVIENVWELFQF